MIDATTLSPQSRLVHDYLMSGRKLTRLIALTNLGVQDVTTRIAELRKLGMEIKDAWLADHFDRRYKEYWHAAP